jgi:hypothetical protein
MQYETAPIPSREEILCVFTSDSQVMTAGEIALEVDANRDAGGPRLLDRQIKPLLADMVRDGVLLTATGDKVGLIGPRVTTTRRTATYYATPRMREEHIADIERAAMLDTAGKDLAARITDQHGDRILTVSGTAQGGVTVELTKAQATALFGLDDPLNDDLDSPGTEHAGDDPR